MSTVFNQAAEYSDRGEVRVKSFNRFFVISLDCLNAVSNCCKFIPLGLEVFSNCNAIFSNSLPCEDYGLTLLGANIDLGVKFIISNY